VMGLEMGMGSDLQITTNRGSLIPANQLHAVCSARVI
jgi:hypothetical protein